MTLLSHIQALSQDQVVAAIYETMIRPEQFDRFTAAPQDRAGDAAVQEGWGQRDRLQAAPVFQAHFSRAADIQEQQWVRAGRPHPGGYSGDCSRFWLLAEAAPGGSVLNASQRAARQLTGGTGLPAAMGLTAAAAERWQCYLAQAGAGDFSWSDVLLLGACAGGEQYLCRPVPMKGGGGAHVAVMAERLEGAWNGEAAGPVAAALGLQEQDFEPLKEAMNGAGGKVDRSLQQIAWRTGVPGIAELVRLTSFLMNEHSRDLAIARGDRLPASETFEDGSGQCSQFFRLGAETGQPVIFVHGMLDGIAPLQRLQPQLRTLGFRVYAPMRRGYGSSSALQRGQDPADAFVWQLEALMARENLQRPVLLSHRGGALYGRVAASRLQSKIAGLVSVASNCAISSPRQFSGLSGYAWLVALGAARANWMLPALMRGWAAALHWYGHKTLLQMQTRRGSRERAMLHQLELLPLLQQSQMLFRQQGGAGFLADVQMLRQGGQDAALARSARVVFVHGAEDRVAPLETIRDAAGSAADARLCVSQEAGALLFYMFPELVLTALQDLAGTADPWS
ncbi:alpha/beta fold hydrolase [Leisingera sp. McT4-56]|uniref:alpha/beta fold hydrolase n=1 Tax=Leisingera sp. McT4-56 TaxID=2881255 RepID=UPI001CF85D6C|nr:alpha/beta fold hydrolase [Leisingera sp. McT4-56]MCB4456392.1 alpha/beta hydrolase [Leisingera sp. McT4-56]